MNRQNERKPRASRFLHYLILLMIGICAFYVWVTQTIRPLYDLSQDEMIPYSINATKTADYSPDFFTPVGNVSLSILLDLFQDLDPASTPENRMATLVVSLQTPVSSVTIPAGSTQSVSTSLATSVIATTIPETAITENPIVLVPGTHIPTPSTPVSPPPPPPLPRPTKEEPLPPVPTLPPTSTPTPTPEPIHLAIIIPSSDGATIIDNDDTKFEVEAWDPAVGTNNGDGVTSVTFRLYDLLGNTIYISHDMAPSYCAFGVSNNCSDAASAGVVLRSDTYTLEVTMLTNAGVTKMATRTFVVLDQTHLDVIVPPTDGAVITNVAETKFEAEAWDSTVGITNGSGITSVAFILYDSIGNIVHTYNDVTPLYCAFGGNVVCGNSAASGVTLNSDTYTIEATAFTDTGGTLTVIRTFTIP